RPWLSELTFRFSPVPVLRISKAAAGIAAPELSRMVPLIDAVAPCANKLPAPADAKISIPIRAAHNERLDRSCFICSPSTNSVFQTRELPPARVVQERVHRHSDGVKRGSLVPR